MKLDRVTQAQAELEMLERRLNEIESALGIPGDREASLWEGNARTLKYFFEDLLEEMIEAAHE